MTITLKAALIGPQTTMHQLLEMLTRGGVTKSEIRDYLSASRIKRGIYRKGDLI